MVNVCVKGCLVNKELLSFCVRLMRNLLIFGLFLLVINYLLYANFSPVWSAVYIIVVPSILTISVILYATYLLLKEKFFSRRFTLISAIFFLILILTLTYPIFNTGLFRQAIIYMQGTCRALSNNTASNLVDALPCLLQTLSYWIALPTVLCGLPILIVNFLTKPSSNKSK
jgi:hypothetical protein